VSPTMLEAGNVERIGTMPVKPGQVPGRGFCSRSRRNGRTIECIRVTGGRPEPIFACGVP
jgi:hypothetical protein